MNLPSSQRDLLWDGEFSDVALSSSSSGPAADRSRMVSASRLGGSGNFSGYKAHHLGGGIINRSVRMERASPSDNNHTYATKIFESVMDDFAIGGNGAAGGKSGVFGGGGDEGVDNFTEFVTFNNSGNWTDWMNGPKDTYVPYGSRPETYIIPLLFAIIFIIGVLGNGTLIVIFLKHRTMRNVPNMYIVSLAAGDLMVVLFVVPFTSTVYTVDSWPYGLLVCKFSEFIKDVSIGVSVFTLTALSADRYFAIVDPMRKLQGRRATRITCLSIIGIWILSIVFALPSVINSFVWTVNDTFNNHTYKVCYPFPDDFEDEDMTILYPKVVVMFRFLVYFFVPLGFIAVFYVQMARHLVLSTRNMPGEAPGQAKQIQSRKKVAKMVLSFVVIFALCFFPSHVFLIWFYFDPQAQKNYNDFWHVVRMGGFCLSFINSCLNPITLYCVSGTFRKHFNNHLFCCCCPAEPRGRSIRGGYSMTNTEYIERMSRNGTQISRTSTVVSAGNHIHGRRLNQNVHQPQQHPHGQWSRNESQRSEGGGKGIKEPPRNITSESSKPKDSFGGRASSAARPPLSPILQESYPMNFINDSSVPEGTQDSLDEVLTAGV